MTQIELQARLGRARDLLQEVHNVAIATVNADGTPHCSPVFMAFDDRLRGIWASGTQSQHSRNIDRTGRAFLVLFDSRDGHGGLYIEAHAGQVPASELESAHAAYKSAASHPIGDLSAYTGETPQRLYQALPEKLWVNQSERDEQGVIIHDRRYEVSLDQLLK